MFEPIPEGIVNAYKTFEDESFITMVLPALGFALAYHTPLVEDEED